MATLYNSELLDFTGGLSTVTAPHLIRKNEAREFVNIDITYGSLKSIPTLHLLKKVPYAFFYEFFGKLITYSEWRANAELNNILYWTNGAEQGKILQDGTELPIGMATPQTPLAWKIQDVGVLKGSLKYCYTFYDSNTGTEGPPSPLSSYANVDEQNLILTGFEPLPSNADSYRIYRVGGYLARFTLVDTVTNVSNGYLDDRSEREVDGRILETLNASAPPGNIENFIEYGGRLFGSVGTKVYYSAIGNGDSWYVFDFFEMPNNVKALAKTVDGILVMGATYTKLIQGYSPSTFRVRTISSEVGCISNRTVAYIQGAPIWLSTTNFYMYTGKLINITYKRLNEVTGLDPSSSVVHNDVYYLTFAPTMSPSEELYPNDDLYPGAMKGTGENELADGIVYIDFKRGAGFSYGTRTYNNSVSIGIFKNTPYLITFNKLELIDECDTVIDCEKLVCEGSYYLNRIDVVVGNNYKSVHYVSPRLIDGSYSTLKEYDKVRLNFIGQFKVKVIFDDNKVVVEELISSDNLFKDTTIDIELLEDKLAIIGIPNNNNKSYSIAFDIEGYGVIKSIQYSWKPRELP